MEEAAKEAVVPAVQVVAALVVLHVPVLVLVVVKGVQVAMERVAVLVRLALHVREHVQVVVVVRVPDVMDVQDVREHAQVAMDVPEDAVLTVAIAAVLAVQEVVAVPVQIRVHRHATQTVMEHAVRRHLVRQ